MIEFILGIRTPLSTTSMPASARMTSNRPGNFPSRSLIKNRARQPASSRSITRFLAACATQDAGGWAVAPRILIFRLACSITASTCSRAPGQGDCLEEVAGQQALGLGAEEIGPRGGTAFGRRVDPGVVQDLPDGGSGDLYPEHQQLAVDTAIPPPGILADQSQHQDANRVHGARPAR